MEIVLPLVLSVVVFAVTSVFVVRRAAALHETMRRVGVELGLRYVSPAAAGAVSGFRAFLASLAPWRLEGTVRGVAVACYPITKGGSRSSTTYTVVEARFASPLGLKLHLGKETALTRLGKAVFDLQDIVAGDARFDAAARVKGKDPAAVGELLRDASVRERIMAALELAPPATVTDVGARYEKQGSLTEAGELRRVIDTLASVVEAAEATRRRG
jgi:hypothetical protein